MRSRTISCPWGALLLGALFGSALSAESQGLLPVSPGSRAPGAATASSCPTFSWAVPAELIERLRGVELRIVSSGEAPDSSTDERRIRLPAAGGSWTPSAEECLEPGARVTWSVRGLRREPSDAETEELAGWSADWQFDVQGRPAEDELAWAIDVLQRARRAAGSTTEAASRIDEPVDEPSVPAARGHAADEAPEAPSADGLAARSKTAAPATVFSSSTFAGLVHVSGIDAEEVSASSVATLAELFAGALTLSSGADALTLWNDGNRAVLSSDFDGTSGSADGFLRVRTLSTTEELEVGYLGMEVRKGAWDSGGGAGSGSVPVDFLVGVGSYIRVDDNPSICPDGSIVVGMRLAETDTDQLGIRVRCTRKPRP